MALKTVLEKGKSREARHLFLTQNQVLSAGAELLHARGIPFPGPGAPPARATADNSSDVSRKTALVCRGDGRDGEGWVEIHPLVSQCAGLANTQGGQQQKLCHALTEMASPGALQSTEPFTSPHLNPPVPSGSYRHGRYSNCCGHFSWSRDFPRLLGLEECCQLVLNPCLWLPHYNPFSFKRSL